jgi:hypothetical protein
MSQLVSRPAFHELARLAAKVACFWSILWSCICIQTHLTQQTWLGSERTLPVWLENFFYLHKQQFCSYSGVLFGALLFLLSATGRLLTKRDIFLVMLAIVLCFVSLAWPS